MALHSAAAGGMWDPRAGRVEGICIEEGEALRLKGRGQSKTSRR